MFRKNWVFSAKIPNDAAKKATGFGYTLCFYQSKFHAQLSEIHEEAHGTEIDESFTQFWDQSQKGKNIFCIVALDPDKNVAGYIRFYLCKTADNYKFVYLRHMAVKESERGSGLGSLLLSVFMTNANLMQKAFNDLKFAYVQPTNESASFYSQKNGGGFVTDDKEAEVSSMKDIDWYLSARLPFSDDLIQKRLSAFKPHIQPMDLSFLTLLSEANTEQKKRSLEDTKPTIPNKHKKT